MMRRFTIASKSPVKTLRSTLSEATGAAAGWGGAGAWFAAGWAGLGLPCALAVADGKSDAINAKAATPCRVKRGLNIR